MKHDVSSDERERAIVGSLGERERCAAVRSESVRTGRRAEGHCDGGVGSVGTVVQRSCRVSSSGLSGLPVLCRGAAGMLAASSRESSFRSRRRKAHPFRGFRNAEKSLIASSSTPVSL